MSLNICSNLSISLPKPVLVDGKFSGFKPTFVVTSDKMKFTIPLRISLPNQPIAKIAPAPKNSIKGINLSCLLDGIPPKVKYTIPIIEIVNIIPIIDAKIHRFLCEFPFLLIIIE